MSGSWPEKETARRLVRTDVPNTQRDALVPRPFSRWISPGYVFYITVKGTGADLEHSGVRKISTGSSGNLPFATETAVADEAN